MPPDPPLRALAIHPLATLQIGLTTPKSVENIAHHQGNLQSQRNHRQRQHREELHRTEGTFKQRYTIILQQDIC